ncbi:hypothetical protein [Streptomyces sp. NBC_01006]|uniref:hypothetical protein n=1 Tax=Streptomyces sp. NBC_01006 TaxID=2903716 RepID=UPI00386DED09|nr:hypothetical protein OG509_02220 [Streptomyces sp. NBC_01006]
MTSRLRPAVADRARSHDDPRVRRLAQPEAAYVEFLGQYPPSLELVRMERTACPERASAAQWRASAYLAGAPGLPVDLVERLAADAEPGVGASAAVNPGLPLHCLALLLADPSPYLAEAAGASALLPVAWMDSLLAQEGL